LFVYTGLTLSHANTLLEAPKSPKPPISSINGIHVSPSKESDSPGSFPDKKKPLSRRASTGALPVRFGPLKGAIDENHESDAMDQVANGMDRLSAHDNTQHYRKRLSIRRSIDFSGESIEVYSRGSLGGGRLSMGGMSAASDMLGNGNQQHFDFDEQDDLRAGVVLELLLKAADVAHALQSWENMTQWMACLFKELVAAHDAGRGFDPRHCWFDMQIQIIDNYLLPLSSQLNEIGVFGEDLGPSFLKALEGNLDRWMTEGYDFTSSLMDDT